MQTEIAYSVVYEIDESNAILVRKILGQITMSEIIELWEKDIQEKRVTKNLKAVITDFTSGKNLSKMEERKDIATFYLENFVFFENIKIAVV